MYSRIEYVFQPNGIEGKQKTNGKQKKIKSYIRTKERFKSNETPNKFIPVFWPGVWTKNRKGFGPFQFS